MGKNENSYCYLVPDHRRKKKKKADKTLKFFQKYILFYCLEEQKVKKK